jgi:hypothetical protein
MGRTRAEGIEGCAAVSNHDRALRSIAGTITVVLYQPTTTNLLPAWAIIEQKGTDTSYLAKHHKHETS